MTLKTRNAWEMNGMMAWYIGPALKHYQYVRCYYSRTKFTRETNPF